MADTLKKVTKIRAELRGIMQGWRPVSFGKDLDMSYSILVYAAFMFGTAEVLGPGDHRRVITVDEHKRTHWIHVPAKYDPKEPAAVVLALHGAMMDAKVMEAFCGLSRTADRHNFIVVYPNGTGPGGVLQTWNAGFFPGNLNKQRADDVKYLSKVLDDLSGVLNINQKRIYVAGLSNGGMMAYRIAAELSDRIAAIASVAGTMVIEKYAPRRPVPVLHFHGTSDLLVPFNGPSNKETPVNLRFRSVEDTIQACIKANGCGECATESLVEMKEDKIKVVRKEYHTGNHGADVVLYVIEGGGHTWPGMNLAPALLGLSTRNISANEIMWDFFRKHALK